MAAGFVYVIGQRGAALVKIGRTTNLERRLAAIQTACPNRVEVLWHTEGGSALERGLHAEFGHFREHGEWFDFGALDPCAMAASRLW